MFCSSVFVKSARVLYDLPHTLVIQREKLLESWQRPLLQRCCHGGVALCQLDGCLQ
jgi:hypothetical protein